MREHLTVGWRRYALLLLVGAGSLGIMGAQCQPTKEAPPTGLSISPTSHDFGDVNFGFESTPQTFTVTNNGPETSGTLTVALEGGDAGDFVTKNDDCTGNMIDAGATCTLDAAFKPNSSGPMTTDLVAKSDEPADGTATAALIGHGHE
jgi:HYDIN/CFA65/VesB-like, Ig-like domain